MPYVTNITYNQYGERQRIDYGNGTFTEYEYDDLRRLGELKHTFSTHDILKQYTYDKVSNVIQIATDPSQNLGILPTNGELACSVLHNYEYDDYNRLVKADGWYVGPNDRIPDLLRQEYSLDMRYDESHNILNKAQNHLRGQADPQDLSQFPSNIVSEAMEETAYNLDYEDYAAGNFTAGGYSYVQPHAPRTIVEYPFGAGADEPSAKRKLLDYDANGNLLLVEQEISDPEDPLGKAKISLRENLWDEENRLLAVDLKPEAPSNKPEVAAYTYDASGERTIKYLPGRLDAYYSAKAAGSADRLESILYPSPLLTVKTRPLPEHMEPDELSRTSITKYTKHYYIGTERIASTLGTMKNLGLLCENVWPGSQDIIDEMGIKTMDAGDVLTADYDAFEKEPQLTEPYLYETYICTKLEHDAKNYEAYWYHPDHLGSSSYITNLDGTINQHMEYLPFGETLVEEHLNSYNSPYKFNAKEFDAETGWYYYGARYYSPKYNLMLSVDPASDLYPGWSPYAYTLQNPVRYVDPTGMVVENPDDIIFNAIDDNGNKIELGRIVTDLFEEEFNIDSDFIPIDLSSHESVEIDINEYTCGETNSFEEKGIQAASLDISGEAAFKGGVQLELSLVGIMAGENKGDMGVSIQGNALAGIEGSVTGSGSVYWSLSGGDLSLDDLRGMEYGVQGSVFGVSGSYFEGFEFKSSFPFIDRVYGGASLGVSVGIPELGGSFSGYVGGSDFIYRSDK